MESTPVVPTPAAVATETAEPEVAAEPATTATAAPKRTRKGKPVMPSWDEVLLGVRGPR